MLNCPSQEKGLSFHLFKPTSVSFEEFLVSLKRFCMLVIRSIPKYFVFPVATEIFFFPILCPLTGGFIIYTKATGFSMLT